VHLISGPFVMCTCSVEKQTRSFITVLALRATSPTPPLVHSPLTSAAMRRSLTTKSKAALRSSSEATAWKAPSLARLVRNSSHDGIAVALIDRLGGCEGARVWEDARARGCGCKQTTRGHGGF